MIKNTARSVIGTGIFLLPSVQAIKKRGLTVFLFHSVNSSPSAFESHCQLSVTPELFKWQMDWILNRYQPISPSDIDENRNFPPHACLITFDDGWAGVFEHAYPLLEKHKVPSLLFVNMEPIEGKALLWAAIAFWLQENTRHPALDLTPGLLKKWEDEKGKLDMKSIEAYQGKLASLQQMQEWDGHPLVFYGNHLYNHWNAATMTDQELKDAFIKNQDVLDDFSSRTRHFAFTFGAYLPHQPSFLLRCGASHIHLCGGGVNRTPLAHTALNRINISSWDDRSSRLHWQTTRRHVETILGEDLCGKIRGYVKGVRSSKT